MSSPTMDSGVQAKVMTTVWDPVVRLFHWTLVGGFFVAYFVEDDWLDLHVWAGYLVLGLVVIRLVWGFVGGRHARWGEFIRSPNEIKSYLRDVLSGRGKRYLGHNPAGGAMVVALMIALIITGLTGLITYGAQELAGPLAGILAGAPGFVGHVFEDLHELFANLTVFLVVLHVAGVIHASYEHRENLVVAMFTGKKRS